MFGSWNLMSYPICRDLQLQDRFFDGVFCRAATTVNLSIGAEPTPTAAEIVSGSYFPVLGVEPALGRLIENDDDATPGANPVVVLSYGFWKTRLAGAADVVGRKVLINQHPMTVHWRGVLGVLGRRCRARFPRSGFPRRWRRKPCPDSPTCWTGARAGCKSWDACGRT